MEAYRREGQVNNPVPLLQLVAQARVTRKHLDVWVTRALSQQRPSVWSLSARLARTWGRGRGEQHHPHSIERGVRESQLARDLALLQRTRYFVDCQRLPWHLRASYLAVLAQVRRLLDGGDWWKAKRYRERGSGEWRETLYLPEQSWSAQTALAWCVALLARLLACVSRVTEKATPRYRPGETDTGPKRGRSGSQEPSWLQRARTRWCDPPGAQPELPAHS